MHVCVGGRTWGGSEEGEMKLYGLWNIQIFLLKLEVHNWRQYLLIPVAMLSAHMKTKCFRLCDTFCPFPGALCSHWGGDWTSGSLVPAICTGELHRVFGEELAQAELAMKRVSVKQKVPKWTFSYSFESGNEEPSKCICLIFSKCLGLTSASSYIWRLSVIILIHAVVESKCLFVQHMGWVEAHLQRQYNYCRWY